MKETMNEGHLLKEISSPIVEKLEQRIVPRKQLRNDFGPTVNYVSRKPYRGINQLILNELHVKSFYLTCKQTIVLGGSIKKGAKSIPVTYWNIAYRDKVQIESFQQKS